MIKNLKYLLFILFLLLSFNINVKADILECSWSERIIYPDGSTYPGTTFKLWGNNYPHAIVSRYSNVSFNRLYDPYGFDATLVLSSKNLYTGATIKASVYFITNFDLAVGKKKYYTTHDSQNDYVVISKIATNQKMQGINVYGNIYKFTYNFTTQDCLDGGLDAYTCYADAYTRSIFFASVGSTDNTMYYLQLYEFGNCEFNDLIYEVPSANDLEDLEQMSVWETIKALPGRLLSWFTALPGNIWNGLKTGFNWVVDAIGDLGGFILDLPGNIWNGLKTGFNWIVDGVTNLLNFFDNDDDVDVSGLSSIGLLPAGAVDSILNLPFTFLDNLNTNLNKQCQSVNIPLPYVNKNLPLPCVNTIFTQISGLSGFISGISVILASLILFKYLINLYKWVDKTLSLKDNNHLDNWGGL